MVLGLECMVLGLEGMVFVLEIYSLQDSEEQLSYIELMGLNDF